MRMGQTEASIFGQGGQKNSKNAQGQHSRAFGTELTNLQGLRGSQATSREQLQRTDMPVDVKMVDSSQSLSYRTQSNPQRANFFYPTNANNSLILNEELNASGSDLNKINPSTILRNNSKILRNSKLTVPALQVNNQMQRGFNQATSARGFESLQGDAFQNIEAAQKV